MSASSGAPLALFVFAPDPEAQAVAADRYAVEFLQSQLRDQARGGMAPPWVEIELLREFEPEALIRRLNDDHVRDRLHLLHFSGHIEDGAWVYIGHRGQRRRVNVDVLAELIPSLPRLRAIVLNGCYSEGLAHRLAVPGGPLVIGTTMEVDARAASILSGEFYGRLLLQRYPIARAFHKAKTHVRNETVGIRGPHGAVDLTNLNATERLTISAGYRLYEGDSPWVNRPVVGGDATAAIPRLRWSPEDLPGEPFRYLSAYEARHAPLLFGRDRDVEPLYWCLREGHVLEFPATADGRCEERVREVRCTVLSGMSGVGKSSLVQAGLLPRLTAHGWVRDGDRDPKAGPVLRYLRADQTSDLAGECARIARSERDEARPGSRPWIVVIDQAEHALTGSTESSEGFFEAIRSSVEAQAVRGGPGAVHWLLVVRQDDQANLWDRLTKGSTAPDLFHQEFLRPLRRDQVEAAVMGIVSNPRLKKHYAATIDPELGRKFADALCGDDGSPISPILQVMLGRMWADAERPGGSRHLTVAGFDRLYREGRGLDDFLDEALASIANQRPESAENGLLLSVLSAHAHRGRALTRAKLQRLYGPVFDEALEITNAAEQHRLLVKHLTDAELGGSATQLVHECIAEPIRRRHGESQAKGPRAERVLRAGLEAAATTQRNLSEAEVSIVEMAEGCRRMLTTDEATLLDRSRDDHDARSRQSLRRRLVVGTVAVVLFALIMVLALKMSELDRQFDLAQQSDDADELANGSVTTASTDFAKSLRRALEAEELASSPTTRAAIRNILLQRPFDQFEIPIALEADWIDEETLAVCAYDSAGGRSELVAGLLDVNSAQFTETYRCPRNHWPTRLVSASAGGGLFVLAPATDLYLSRGEDGQCLLDFEDCGAVHAIRVPDGEEDNWIVESLSMELTHSTSLKVLRPDPEGDYWIILGSRQQGDWFDSRASDWWAYVVVDVASRRVFSAETPEGLRPWLQSWPPWVGLGPSGRELLVVDPPWVQELTLREDERVPVAPPWFPPSAYVDSEDAPERFSFGDRPPHAEVQGDTLRVWGGEREFRLARDPAGAYRLASSHRSIGMHGTSSPEYRVSPEGGSARSDAAGLELRWERVYPPTGARRFDETPVDARTGGGSLAAVKYGLSIVVRRDTVEPVGVSGATLVEMRRGGASALVGPTGRLAGPSGEVVWIADAYSILCVRDGIYGTARVPELGPEQGNFVSNLSRRAWVEPTTSDLIFRVGSDKFYRATPRSVTGGARLEVGLTVLEGGREEPDAGRLTRSWSPCAPDGAAVFRSSRALDDSGPPYAVSLLPRGFAVIAEGITPPGWFNSFVGPVIYRKDIGLVYFDSPRGQQARVSEDGTVTWSTVRPRSEVLRSLLDLRGTLCVNTVIVGYYSGKSVQGIEFVSMKDGMLVGLDIVDRVSSLGSVVDISVIDGGRGFVCELDGQGSADDPKQGRKLAIGHFYPEIKLDWIGTIPLAAGCPIEQEIVHGYYEDSKLPVLLWECEKAPNDGWSGTSDGWSQTERRLVALQYLDLSFDAARSAAERYLRLSDALLNAAKP